VEEIEAKKYLYLVMDATTEEALLQVGIMKARGIVTVVNSDANNVFITMTAKSLRPDIFVLARATDEKNEGKLVSDEWRKCSRSQPLLTLLILP
jgi:voltage-gated potassium channel